MFNQTNRSSPLSSMRTAIFLLLLLAAIAALGSIIPQGQQPAFYSARYGLRLGSLMLLLSLDHLYTAWWFLTLAALLALNLLLCSLKRLRHYKNYQELGSIILHLSMLVIFIGAIISGLASRQVYLEIGVGDSVHIGDNNFPHINIAAPDFHIDYYASHEPKQYTSQLQITDEKGQKVQRPVSVNHPLKVHGVKIYQQNYGFLVAGQVQGPGEPVKFEVKNGQEVTIDQEQNLRLKMLFIPDYDEQNKTLQSKSPMLHNPRLVVALIKGDKVLAAQPLAKGETGKLQGYNVTFHRYRYFTGLQVKKDPGTPVVFGGFIMLTAGFMIRYLGVKK